MAGLLDSETGRLLKLEGLDELLADVRTVGPPSDVQSYVDPVLAHSPRLYGRFLTRLHESGMLGFVPGRYVHTVGVFFILKKKKEQQIAYHT